MPKCNGKSRGYNIRRKAISTYRPKKHWHTGPDFKVACGQKDWTSLGHTVKEVTCWKCINIIAAGRA